MKNVLVVCDRKSVWDQFVGAIEGIKKHNRTQGSVITEKSVYHLILHPEQMRGFHDCAVVFVGFPDGIPIEWENCARIARMS